MLTRRTLLSLPLALVIGPALAACSGGGRGGGSEVEYLSEGSGETNEEPLWPLRPGWLMQASGYSSTYAALDERVIGGRTVMPLASQERGAFEYIGVPSEPAYYRYLAVDDEGVWFHGQPREGLLGGGALLVPREVRVGMKWESRVGEGKRFTVEVAGREVEQTIFGERPVWTLSIADERRYHYEGSNGYDAPRLTGFPSEMRLAEGRGPITNHLIAGTGMEALAGLTGHVVVPLEDGTSEPVTAPRAALAPVAGGAPVFEDFLVLGAGAFPDPADPDALILATRGLTLAFGQMMFDDGYGGGYVGGGEWTEIPEVRCIRLRGDTLEELGDRDPSCAPADAIMIKRDGQALALPWTSSGSSVPEHFCPPNSMDCLPSQHQFRALVEDDDGTPLALAWSTGRAEIPGAALIGRYDDDYYVESNLSYPDGWETYPTVLPFLGVRPYGEGAGSTSVSFWWTRRHDDGQISVVDVAGGHTQGPGRMAFTRLADHPHAADEHFVFPTMEVQSTVVGPGTQEHFIFGYEGLLRQVHLRRDRIELEPIAELSAPRGEFLTAAFVVGDEIIAFSQRGMLAADPWYTETGINRSIHTTVGNVHAFRAPLPGVRPAPARPASIFGVQARPFDKDVRICWPPGSGTLDAGSFTLAGKEPAAVVTEGSCVMLIREAITDHTPLDEPGAWAIEGTIPGAGRVAIALSPDVWSSMHFTGGWEHPRGSALNPVSNLPMLVGAPLAGGGSVSTAAVYGPGLISTFDQNQLLDTGGRAVHDAAGNGLWLYRPRWNEHSVSLFHRDGERRVDLEPFVAQKNLPGDLGYEAYPVAVVGGGVLVGDLLVSPDGTVRDLPAPTLLDPSNGRFMPRVAWNDGTVCGTKNDTLATGSTARWLVCIAADGTERSSPPDAMYTAEPGGAWVATENAIWAATPGVIGTTLARIDRATLTVTANETGPYSDALIKVRHDAAGKIYLVYTQPGGHAIVRLDDSGLSPLALPDLEIFRGASEIDLVVEEDLFMAISLGRMNAQDVTDLHFEPPDVVRIPRAGR